MARQITPGNQATAELQYLIGVPVSNKTVQTRITDIFTDVAAVKADTVILKADTVTLKADTVTLKAAAVAIQAKTDNLPANTATALSSIEGKVDTTSSNVSDVKAAVTTGASSLSSLKTLIDSVQATATAIQNNTRLTSSIPQEVEVPVAGAVYSKMYINLYDSVGNKEDPDSNEVAVILTDGTGVDITAARLFKTNTGTALDTGTEFSSNKKMNRDSAGRYFFFYKATSTDTADTLNVQLMYNEGAVLNGSDRSLRVVAQLGANAATVANQTTIINNLAVVDGIVDAVKLVTDALPNAGALTSIAQDSTVAKAAALATAKGVMDAVKLVTDALPNAGALTSIAQDSTVAKDATVAKSAALTTAQAAITAIKAVTDVLPNSGTLSSIAQASALATAKTAIDAIKLVTDALPNAGALSSLAQASALAALDTKVSAIAQQKAIRAAKTSSSIAAAATTTVVLSTAEGFNAINAELHRIDVTVAAGATQSYDVEVFEDVGLTKSVILVQAIGPEGLYLGSMNEIFTNQNSTPDKNLYVKISNTTDAGSSSFAVKVRGLTLLDTLA
jgi:hypothetical protein